MKETGPGLFLYEAVPRSPVLDPMQVARARVVAESEEEALGFLADGLQAFRQQTASASDLKHRYLMNRLEAVRWSGTKAEWLQSALLGQVDPPAIWLPPIGSDEIDLAVPTEGTGEVSDKTRVEIPPIDPKREEILRKILVTEHTVFAISVLTAVAGLALSVYWLLFFAPVAYPMWKWARMIRLGMLNSTKGFQKVWGRLTGPEILAYLWKYHRKTLDVRRSVAFARRKTSPVLAFYNDRGHLSYRTISSDPGADEFAMIQDVVKRLEAQDRMGQVGQVTKDDGEPLDKKGSRA